jgi:hypothetical protein
MNKIFDETCRTAEIEVSVGHIEVRAKEGAKNAAVVLEPMTPGGKEALKAIERATVELENGQLRVTVKLPDTMVSGGGSSVVSINGQTFVGGNGITVINGRIVGGGNAVRCDGVRATVYLPADVGVRANTTSATIQVIGRANLVQAHSVSGDLIVEEAGSARLNSTSGGIRVGRVSHAVLHTVSGSIDAEAILDSGSLESVSGSVHARTETQDFTARTVSGSVRVTQGAGVSLPRSALSTVSGSRSLR